MAEIRGVVHDGSTRATLFLIGEGGTPEESAFVSYLSHFIAWYAYLALFLFLCFRHYKDVKRERGVFDFGKYRKFSGRIHEFFYKITLFGKQGDPRTIQCWIEPAPFFIVGLLLLAIGQYLGTLFILSSIAYSVSYIVAYEQGDNFVLDKIDEMIINAGMEKIFLGDDDETRGFRFMGSVPEDPEMRKAMWKFMTQDADDGPLAR